MPRNCFIRCQGNKAPWIYSSLISRIGEARYSNYLTRIRIGAAGTAQISSPAPFHHGC
jgi:hypothetical protein